ncbi:MAG: hypothetical protein IPL47_01565 [Phyllobacteriaceae bacterium]|nr:hypothetical protein [Phyllobacteriaceae bacterium]
MNKSTVSRPRRRALVIADRAVDRIVLSRFVALAGIGVDEVDLAGSKAMLMRGAHDLLVIDSGQSNDNHVPIIAGLSLSQRPEIIVVARDQEIARLLNGDPEIGAAICQPVTSDKVVPTVHHLLEARVARTSNQAAGLAD